MRKVVSYNKRHLAQEGKAKQDPNSRSARSKSASSVFPFIQLRGFLAASLGTLSINADTFSIVGLKNWGHDPQKS